MGGTLSPRKKVSHGSEALHCVTPKDVRSIRNINGSTSDLCNESYRTLSRTKPNIQPALRLETAWEGPTKALLAEREGRTVVGRK